MSDFSEMARFLLIQILSLIVMQKEETDLHGYTTPFASQKLRSISSQVTPCMFITMLEVEVVTNYTSITSHSLSLETRTESSKLVDDADRAKEDLEKFANMT